MILTLNFRGHVMLPMFRDHFKMTSRRMKSEIQAMHRETVTALRGKGIAYGELRSALTPSTDRHEVALIFDSTLCETGLYGMEAMHCILPLLEPDANLSVLAGDLIADSDRQRLVFELLSESMVLARSFTFRGSSLLFCVYLNNLSKAALSKLTDGLRGYEAYLGHIQTTFDSHVKTYLTTTLVGAFVKRGRKVITAHEDDRPNSENENLSPYEFERFGYKHFSIQGTDYYHFLTYKIERAVHDLNEDDAQFSLNALSEAFLPLDGFSVRIDEAKHEYLLNDKSGVLKKAGIHALERENLEGLIRSKMTANYIYNMTYIEAHDVMKFNIMLEFERDDGGHPARVLASLEYMPTQKTVRVITMY